MNVIEEVDRSSLIRLRYTDVSPDDAEHAIVVRSVHARVDIPEGTLVEVCPVVPLYVDDVAARSVNAVASYAFKWEVRDDDGSLVVDRALAMGMGGIYNHADNGNLRKEAHEELFLLEFYADRDISAGEELTHTYHWGPDAGRFAPVDRYLRPIPRRSLSRLIREGQVDPALAGGTVTTDARA